MVLLVGSVTLCVLFCNKMKRTFPSFSPKLMVSMCVVFLVLFSGSVFLVMNLLETIRRPQMGVDHVDFMVIGVQKGGTSSLSQWIASHPQINPPLTKELMYWATDCSKNEQDYLRLFPRREGRNVTGEFSAKYFIGPPCLPQRLYNMNKKLKLILVLRDPLQRCHSHFIEQRDYCDCPHPSFYCSCRPSHNLTKSFSNFSSYFTTITNHLRKKCPFPPFTSPLTLTPSSFDSLPSPFSPNTKFMRTVTRAHHCLQRGLPPSSPLISPPTIFYQSFYDIFLLSFLSVFPPSQILVLYTERDLEEKRRETMKKIEAFLEVEEGEYEKLERFNGKGCYGWNKACKETKKEGEEEREENEGEEWRKMKEVFSSTVHNLRILGEYGVINMPPPGWGE